MLLYLRHLRARRTARRQLDTLGHHRLSFDHRIETLRIRFLVDFFPADSRFVGEAGVSYLIEADRRRVLFDLGYNQAGAEVPPLRTNLAALDLDPLRVDGVFLSHNHLDHVGGFDHQRSKQPATAGLELGSAPLWAPLALASDSGAQWIRQPTELLPGIASSGPMPAPLYLTGLLHEQAMWLAVRDRGLVLVTGCGHPGISEMVRLARRVTGERVFAVVGGLHLIASQGRTRLQKYLGANRPPWALPGPRGVRREIEALRELGVEQIAPSAHDSCDRALDIMKEVFADGYRPLRAGGEIGFGTDRSAAAA